MRSRYRGGSRFINEESTHSFSRSLLVPPTVLVPTRCSRSERSSEKAKKMKMMGLCLLHAQFAADSYRTARQ